MEHISSSAACPLSKLSISTHLSQRLAMFALAYKVQKSFSNPLKHSLLFFFMNYQQYRTITSSTSVPTFHVIYNKSEEPTHNHQSHTVVDHQQTSSRFFHKQIHPPKQPLTEFKSGFEFSKINSQPSGPLNFSLATPQKLKAKKTGRPMAKITHKSHIATSPKQFDGDLFKEESSQMTRVQFSRTSGMFYPPQTQTQPSTVKLENLPGSGQSLRSHLSRESKSKIMDSSPYQGNISLNAMLGTRNQQFLLETINSQKMEIKSFQGEIVHVNMELRALRDKEERNQMRASRKKEQSDKIQLQLKTQQNSKLLIEIESMEKELKGKLELNKYLEHQCNIYLTENKILKESAKELKEQLVHKEEIVAVLHKEIDGFEKRTRDLNFSAVQAVNQMEKLNKAIDSQRESIQQMQMSSDVDKSEINMLKTKIETLQKKYEQLMGSFLEIQSASNLKEQCFLQEQKGFRNLLQQLELGKELLERDLNNKNSQNMRLLKEYEEAERKGLQLTELISEIERTNQQISQEHTNQKHQWLQMHGSLQKLLEEFKRESATREESKDRQIYNLEHQLKAERQKHLDQQQIFKKQQQHIMQLTLQLQRTEETLKEKEESIFHLQISLRKNQQSLNLHVKELVLCQNQLAKQQKFSSSLLERAERQKSDYESELSNHQQSLAIQEQEKFTIKKQFLSLRERLANLESSYDSLRQSNNELQTIHSQLLGRSCSYANSNNQLEGMYSALEEQYLQLQKRLKEIQEERDLLKIEKELLSIRSSQKERELSRMRQLHSKNLEQLSGLQDKGQKLKQENMRLRDDKSKFQELNSELRRQINSLLYIVDENQQRFKAEMKSKQQLIICKEREMMTSVTLFTQTQSNLQTLINQLRQELLIKDKEYLAQINSKDEFICIMDEKIAQLTAQLLYETNKNKELFAMEGYEKRGWASSDSLGSPCSEEGEKQHQIVSMGNLGEGQVHYIEMDKEGIDYLCQLLAIETSQGNLLTQIVAQVEEFLERQEREGEEIISYRQSLSLFGVEAKPSGLKTLLSEVLAAKENLCLLVSKLTEEEKRSEIIQRDYQGLINMQEVERQCRIAFEKQYAVLICELNEEIARLNARLLNHKFQIKQTLSLVSEGCSSRIRSEAFVTAHSFEMLPEQ